MNEAGPLPFNPYAAPSAPLHESAIAPVRALASPVRALLGRRLYAAFGDYCLACGSWLLVYGVIAAALHALYPQTFALMTSTYFHATRAVVLALLVVTMLMMTTRGESSSTGATAGKGDAGFAVATIEGGRVGFSRALFRNLIKLATIPLWPISVWMMVRDPKQRAIHDHLAGTIVLVDLEHERVRAFLRHIQRTVDPDDEP